MLVLFDIDLTLVRSRGAGLEAMVDAGRRAFGRTLSGDGVDVAGRLDPLILRDLLTSNGIEATRDNLTAARLAYIEALPSYLVGRAEALPGTLDLIGQLANEPGVTLGVLTGNFAETGTMKLEAAGFEMRAFEVTVWGDDGMLDPPSRDHLPPVAVERYRTLRGSDPERTVVIGDTPHDIACALANDCVALGVATGRTDAEDLRAAGAHRVVADLSDTPDIAGWLLG